MNHDSIVRERSSKMALLAFRSLRNHLPPPIATASVRPGTKKAPFGWSVRASKRNTLLSLDTAQRVVSFSQPMRRKAAVAGPRMSVMGAVSSVGCGASVGNPTVTVPSAKKPSLPASCALNVKRPVAPPAQSFTVEVAGDAAEPASVETGRTSSAGLATHSMVAGSVGGSDFTFIVTDSHMYGRTMTLAGSTAKSSYETPASRWVGFAEQPSTTDRTTSSTA